MNECWPKTMVKGVQHPTPKLAYFVLYLKNINLFEKQYMHLIVNSPRNSKIALKFR